MPLPCLDSQVREKNVHLRKALRESLLQRDPGLAASSRLYSSPEPRHQPLINHPLPSHNDEPGEKITPLPFSVGVDLFRDQTHRYIDTVASGYILPKIVHHGSNYGYAGIQQTTGSVRSEQRPELWDLADDAWC